MAKEIMEISFLAGKLAEPGKLINEPELITAYYKETPDPSIPGQRVAFGTSGYRGSAFDKVLNEWHIRVITQAICLYRNLHKSCIKLYRNFTVSLPKPYYFLRFRFFDIGYSEIREFGTI